LFQTKNLQLKTISEHPKKSLKLFLMKKYNIKKYEIIDVWESIVNGLSRKEYAITTKINENTIKTWRNELYKKLKKTTFTTTRYSDYKAVIEYYNSFLAYKTLLKLK